MREGERQVKGPLGPEQGKGGARLLKEVEPQIQGHVKLAGFFGKGLAWTSFRFSKISAFHPGNKVGNRVVEQTAYRNILGGGSCTDARTEQVTWW